MFRLCSLLTAACLAVLCLGCGPSAPAGPSYNQALQSYETELKLLDRLDAERNQKINKFVALVEKNNEEFDGEMTIEEGEKQLGKIMDVEREARQKLKEELRRMDVLIWAQRARVNGAKETVDSLTPKTDHKEGAKESQEPKEIETTISVRPKDSPANQEHPGQMLEIKDVKLTTRYYRTGSIRKQFWVVLVNLSDVDAKSGYVEFGYFDRDGVKLGGKITNLDKLHPRGNLKFTEDIEASTDEYAAQVVTIRVVQVVLFLEEGSVGAESKTGLITVKPDRIKFTE